MMSMFQVRNFQEGVDLNSSKYGTFMYNLLVQMKER